MKELLNRISKKLEESRNFFSVRTQLDLSKDLTDTCIEFLGEFDGDYSGAEIGSVASIDGVFLIDFTSNGDSYICKTFFDEMLTSKNTEVSILTAANGERKTGMYPTEEMVESNSSGVIVFKENAASFENFPKQSLDSLMPSVVRSQALFHKIKAKTANGSFLKIYESMSELNEDFSIKIDYKDVIKDSFDSCYEKLKGGKKVVCLGSYEFKNYRIQEIGEYDNTAVKFFNCWYSVNDYAALDYALMIEFACDEGADRSLLHKALEREAGKEILDQVKSIQPEVSNLTALTYFLFLTSESRNRPKYIGYFVNKVRLSTNPKKFKKMLEKIDE